MALCDRHSRRYPFLRPCVVLSLALTTLACFSDGNATGPSACERTARFPDAIGCAYVFGKITDARGVALDEIEGLVRLGDSCVCSSPRLEGDENGVYSTIVHRLPRPGGFSDTATATVVALASAAKYPRHVTGAAYFDTSRVVLRFAAMGATPPALEVNLRITLPGQ